MTRAPRREWPRTSTEWSGQPEDTHGNADEKNRVLPINAINLPLSAARRGGGLSALRNGLAGHYGSVRVGRAWAHRAYEDAPMSQELQQVETGLPRLL